MKMNKRIIVSALAVTMGAGLVGSISGTVAWYQYSTRATVQMMGVSLGVARNLQVAVTAADVNTAPVAESAWKSEIGTNDLLTALSKTEFEFEPITTSAAYTKDAGLGSLTFKSNPIKYKTNPAEWANASADAYVAFNLWVRASEKAEDGTVTMATKALGLTDARIANANAAASTKSDISSAVRLSIESSEDKAIIAKDVASTNLYGPLDLDDVPGNDKAHYYSEIDEATADLVYGVEDAVGTTYNLALAADRTALYSNEVANANGDYDITGGIDLGQTADGAIAKLKVSVWLEGWQKFADKAVWSVTDYANSKFFVGFEIGSGVARA